jgi:hypothetical protein
VRGGFVTVGKRRDVAWRAKAGRGSRSEDGEKTVRHEKRPVRDWGKLLLKRIQRLLQPVIEICVQLKEVNQ